MSDVQIQELIASADNAYYAADYEKAIDLYKQALSLNSGNKHAREQIQKAEFYLSVKAVKPEDLMAEALQLYKRSRSFIAIHDLDGAKMLLQQAIDIAKEAGVDFIDAKALLENILDVVKAMEFKSKACDELDKRQWIKAEENLSFATDLDPTDHTIKKLLDHLRGLLKAQKSVRQLDSYSRDVETHSRLDNEIRDILELTKETHVLSDLWQLVYEARHQVIAQDQEKGQVYLPKIFPDKEGNDEKIETLVPKVFISYSHKVEKYKDELVKMLAPLHDQNILVIWHDREIEPGYEWYDSIKDAMNTCDLALLLVSGDFLASRFIRDEELSYLLQRRKNEGLRIVPIIVSECLWQSVPILRDLQVLPKNGKPVVSFSGLGSRDKIWTDIGKAIESIAKNL